MANKNFIPTLGNASDDVLTDPVSCVEYIVAFSLINPGFTSEQYEHDMLSISSLLAEYDPQQAAEIYESKLQSIISTQLPSSNYMVSVSLKQIDEVSVDMEIIVGDVDGTTILRQEHVLKRLRKD